jgi:hypothetical protein
MMEAVLDKLNLGPRYRSAITIVLALVTSVLVYTLVAYVLVMSSSSAPRETNEQLVQALYGVAGAISVGTIVLRRILFSASRLARIVEEHGLRRLVDELASKTLMLAVLSELVAVVGLLLSFLTQSFDPMWRLGTVSVLLLLYHLPRRSAWERTVNEFSRIAYEES